MYSSTIAYKFSTSEGSTGANQATIYGTFNSANFNVPNLPSDGSNIDVTFYVNRVAPDGIAGDIGYMYWYVDSVPQDYQEFDSGLTVSRFSVLSINKNSVVVVTVQEG